MYDRGGEKDMICVYWLAKRFSARTAQHQHANASLSATITHLDALILEDSKDLLSRTPQDIIGLIVILLPNECQ